MSEEEERVIEEHLHYFVDLATDFANVPPDLFAADPGIPTFTEDLSTPALLWI
jgi:hypothetical protein